MKKLILDCVQKAVSIMLTALLLLSTISFEVFAEDPKISIIIPVYNTPENLLRDCLNSAKNQTLKDIEIICVDDGSTDGSGKILDEYANSDPRFKVIHQKNAGCAVARNKCLDIAKGEYIQFLDSDDTIDPTMSEKCYDKAKEYSADIVKCGHIAESEWAKFSVEDKVTVGPAFHFEGSGLIWNGIWKRIFSKGDKLYFLVDSRKRSDEVLNLIFMPKANKIVYFQDKLYHYKTQNPNSITSIFGSEYTLKCISKNIEFIYENWKSNGYFSDNIAKIDLLKFILHCYRTSPFLYSVKYKYNLITAGVGSEILQDDVVNRLPAAEKIQLKSIMLRANAQKIIDDGIYTISSKLDPNSCLSINQSSKDDKANLQLCQKNGTDAQKFKIQYHDEGYYTIEAVCSGKFIDVSASGKKNGTNIWQYSGNGADTQKWLIVPDGEGYYCLVRKCKDLCMDVCGAEAKNGANIHCWGVHGGDTQRFKIEKCADKPSVNKTGDSKKDADKPREVLAANPKVSIIIPVYNTPENLLRDCLESAKNQTLKDIEIICVDDGSTSGSGKILDEYEKSDPRFVIVHKPNGGCSSARDKGMDLAKGEYIQFLDSDDVIDLTTSEKCYNAAKEYDADIVKFPFRIKNFDKVKVFKTSNLLSYVGDIYALIWNGIYRKKLLDDYNLRWGDLKGGAADDSLFSVTCLGVANKIVNIPNILYQNRKHEMSLTKGGVASGARKKGLLVILKL